MADDKDSSDFAVGTWRLVLFFLFILVIDTLWELTDERVTHSLIHCGRKGLIHAWEKIKFEIMALGLVSLILLVVEEFLLKICVDKNDKEVDEALAPISAYDPAAAARRLMAAKYEDTCPEGKEQFWPSGLMHKIHILIFLIAVSHVLYALLSLGISILSLQRFQAFERTAREGSLEPLPLGQLQKEGENWFLFGARQTLRQFTHPLDRETYIAMRRLFFERVKLDESYNFANFVTEFLMEEFASVVKLEWLMWGVALVWIAFPEDAYAGIWMTGAFVLLSVAAGGKLQTIAMHLARQAYSLYYVPLEAKLPPVDTAEGSDSGSSGIAAQTTPQVAAPMHDKRSTAAERIVSNTAQNSNSATLQTEASKPPSTTGPTGVRTNRMACALPRTSQVFRAPKGPPSVPEPATDPPSTPTAAPAEDATKPPTTPAREARTAAETCILELNGEKSSPDATQTAQNPNPPLLVNTVNSSAPNPSQFPGMPRVKPMKKLKYEELFWFKRPRLLLTIFQYAYFENALALAILAFAFWKEEYSMIGGGISGSRDKTGFNSKSVSAGLVLLALDVALLVHSSWFVLPMHALTAASVHFSSPQALLEVAKQRNMRLDLVHFIEDAETAEGLIRTSASPPVDAGSDPHYKATSPPPTTRTNPVHILSSNTYLTESNAVSRASSMSKGGPGAVAAGTAAGAAPEGKYSIPRANRLSRASCPVVHLVHASSNGGGDSGGAGSLARASLGKSNREIHAAVPRPNLQRSSVGGIGVGLPRSSLHLHRSSLGSVSIVSGGSAGTAAAPPAPSDAPKRGPFSSSPSRYVERSALEEMIEAMAQTRLNALQATPEGACAVDIALQPEHSAQRMGLSSAPQEPLHSRRSDSSPPAAHAYGTPLGALHGIHERSCELPVPPNHLERDQMQSQAGTPGRPGAGGRYAVGYVTRGVNVGGAASSNSTGVGAPSSNRSPSNSANGESRLNMYLSAVSSLDSAGDDAAHAVDSEHAVPPSQAYNLPDMLTSGEDVQLQKYIS